MGRSLDATGRLHLHHIGLRIEMSFRILDQIWVERQIIERDVLRSVRMVEPQSERSIDEIRIPQGLHRINMSESIS